jgi:pimeloyl-ACP methyl ester carboxylesterase
MGISLTSADVTMLTMPVLTIHGRKDRSGPYGGARDWANLLPNGQLLTIEDGGHMPWIEAPAEVLSAIERFLQ